jgi:hypothetical protein
MPFELTETTELKLLHVNHRKEFHGEDRVLAVDLNFEWETSNDCLDKLDANLRQALFYNAAAVEGQESLPEVLKVLPNLRVPDLNGGKFKFRGNDKFKGYTFELDYGLGDEQSNITFEDCAVGKYEIETKEGGTVILRLQVSYAGEKITEESLFKLIGHEGEKAFITIKAPAALTLIKGGKLKTKVTAVDDDGGEETLFDSETDDEAEVDEEKDTPEKAAIRAHAGA